MQTNPARSVDTLTLIAIAAVVYVLATLIHEGLGHGGACVLVGGKPLVLSSVHFECDDSGIGRNGTRLVAAGGTLANFVAGLLSLGGLRVARRGSAHLRFFLWLLMTVNLLQGAGYFLFSGVANIGDWAEVGRDLSHIWLWRIGLVVAGATLYLACVWLALREMTAFIGSGNHRIARAKKLALVPYLAGGILSCIAGVFNPVGMVLVAISAAAASFGGTSALAWMTEWLKSDSFPARPGPAISIDRRWNWIVAGAVLAVLFVAVLGPGIRLR